jgi:hypothetical protein
MGHPFLGKRCANQSCRTEKAANALKHNLPVPIRNLCEESTERLFIGVMNVFDVPLSFNAGVLDSQWIQFSLSRS